MDDCGKACGQTSQGAERHSVIKPYVTFIGDHEKTHGHTYDEAENNCAVKSYGTCRDDLMSQWLLDTLLACLSA